MDEQEHRDVRRQDWQVTLDQWDDVSTGDEDVLLLDDQPAAGGVLDISDEQPSHLGGPPPTWSWGLCLATSDCSQHAWWFVAVFVLLYQNDLSIRFVALFFGCSVLWHALCTSAVHWICHSHRPLPVLWPVAMASVKACLTAGAAVCALLWTAQQDQWKPLLWAAMFVLGVLGSCANTLLQDDLEARLTAGPPGPSATSAAKVRRGVGQVAGLMAAGGLLHSVGLQRSLVAVAALQLLLGLLEALLLVFARPHCGLPDRPSLQDPTRTWAAAAPATTTVAWASSWLPKLQQKQALAAALLLASLRAGVLAAPPLVVACLSWEGLGPAEAAAVWGAVVACGLLGLAACPPVSGRLGLRGAALLGSCWHVAAVATAVVGLVVGPLVGWQVPRVVQLALVVGGLVGCAPGLQLLGGCVEALQAQHDFTERERLKQQQALLEVTAQVLVYAMAALLPARSQFAWLVLASACTLLAAPLLYAVFLCSTRQRYQLLSSTLAFS